MEVTSSQRKPIARWAKPADRILINELLRHLRNGRKVGNKYSPEVWSQVTAQVNKPYLGTDIPILTIHQVKGRYTSLRKNLKDFLSLLGTVGFHWNREKGKIEAETDSWARYLRAHPRAGVFKQRPLEHFDELRELFDGAGKTIGATGAQADEEPDEEPEDQMDENHQMDENYQVDENYQMDEDDDLSADNGASESVYQKSPIPNTNGALVSNFDISIRSAPTPAWNSYSAGPASPEFEGNNGYGAAGSKRGKCDSGGRYLTEIVRTLADKIDKLVTTIESHQGVGGEQSPQFLALAEAVGKAAKLYHDEDISKEEFRLAVDSLKKDVLDCIAFSNMSDELRIDWIAENAKEEDGETY